MIKDRRNARAFVVARQQVRLLHEVVNHVWCDTKVGPLEHSANLLVYEAIRKLASLPSALFESLYHGIEMLIITGLGAIGYGLESFFEQTDVLGNEIFLSLVRRANVYGAKWIDSETYAEFIHHVGTQLTPINDAHVSCSNRFI